MTGTERLPRAAWFFLGVVVVGVVVTVSANAITRRYWPERVQYTEFLPPDTAHWRLPLIDSLGRRVATCFGKPTQALDEVRWFTSDSALGKGESKDRELVTAEGRYYQRERAVVLLTYAATDAWLIEHEWRHVILENPEHPPVFWKDCQ